MDCDKTQDRNSSCDLFGRYHTAFSINKQRNLLLKEEAPPWPWDKHGILSVYLFLSNATLIWVIPLFRPEKKASMQNIR
jgi:hypothetical protein